MNDERGYQRGGGTAELLGRRNDSADIDEIRPESRDTQLPAGSAGQLPLLSEEKVTPFRERWEACQRGFVDEPRSSVEMADQLVADVVRDLAAQFADERQKLEQQWDRGEEVSTEELRLALQRYRSFFERLLKV